MPNTSATGGYLSPAASPAPLEGEQLDDFLHDVVAGITGLANELVLPRWQPEPVNIPTAGTVWAAVGVRDRSISNFPEVDHDPSAQGTDSIRQQEQLEVQVSFYGLGAGSDADKYCAILRDGLYIAQNREAMMAQGFVLAYVGTATPAPLLLKERWLYRVDLAITLRRQIDRTYSVLSLLSANGTITAEAGERVFTDEILVEPSEP